MNSSDLKKIAEDFPTPMYVFDMDEFDKRIAYIKKALGVRAELCYAMKANPLLIKRADRSVEKFEVCSPGEFNICMESGISPEKIVFSGVYKDPVSTGTAVEILAGHGCVTAESAGQLELLESCAKNTGKITDVILRITSGNQFGMDKDEITGIVKKRSEYPFLNIKGFQLYSGTQKRKTRTIEKELEKLDSLISFCENEFGFVTSELEYGPGLPVNYFEGDDYDEDHMLQCLADGLNGMRYEGHITIEMGRFVVSSCGHYLTSVGDIKINNGNRCIITDGGSHQLKYFGQNMGMKTPFYEFLPKENSRRSGDPESWDVYGALCTVHDVVAKELVLDNPQPGDVFLFKNTGAYSVTEGSALFLSRDLPLVICYDSEQGVQIMRQRMFTYTFNCPGLI